MTAAPSPILPVLRYPGSKARLAPWIVAQMPAHRVYVEPFAGSLAVLFAKPRGAMEIVNDLNGSLTAFFRLLREDPEALAQAVRLTPYSRAEYRECGETETYALDALEAARRFLVRSWQSIGGRPGNSWKIALTPNTGSPQSITWKNLPARLLAAAERLMGVQIEERAALDLISRCAFRETLLYVDPPYPLETRGGRKYYAHEMTTADHEELLAALNRHPGPVLLSGFDCPLYRDALAHWRFASRAERTMGNTETQECLWIKQAPQ